MQDIVSDDYGVHIPAFASVKAVFSNRLGGVSNGVFYSLNLGFGRGDDDALVKRNYEIICDRLGVDTDSLVFNKQVHGNTVNSITSLSQCMGLDTSKIPENADVFVTNLKGVTLTCFYADCTPILFYDPVNKVIATAHAGWRGTVCGSQCAAVQTMCEQYGCERKNILVAIGPCISAKNYQVGNEVASHFHSQSVTIIDGVEHVDLRKENSIKLQLAGIDEKNIFICDDCTFENEKYFSHRRMGEQRGSGVAFISL